MAVSQATQIKDKKSEISGFILERTAKHMKQFFQQRQAAADRFGLQIDFEHFDWPKPARTGQGHLQGCADRHPDHRPVMQKGIDAPGARSRGSPPLPHRTNRGRPAKDPGGIAPGQDFPTGGLAGAERRRSGSAGGDPEQVIRQFAVGHEGWSRPVRARIGSLQSRPAIYPQRIASLGDFPSNIKT